MKEIVNAMLNAHITVNSIVLEVTIDKLSNEVVGMCTPDEAEKLCDVLEHLEAAKKLLDSMMSN